MPIKVMSSSMVVMNLFSERGLKREWEKEYRPWLVETEAVTIFYASG